jgi:hypothetical protein
MYRSNFPVPWKTMDRGFTVHVTVCTQPNSTCTMYVTLYKKYSGTSQQNLPADYSTICGSKNVFIHGLQNQLCNLPVVLTSMWHSLRHCSYPHCSRQVLTTRFLKLSFHFWWNSDFIHISYLLFSDVVFALTFASHHHFTSSRALTKYHVF